MAEGMCLADRLVVGLNDHASDWLVSWSVGRSVGWSVGRSVGFLKGWFCWLICQPYDRLVGLLASRWVCQLVGRLFASLVWQFVIGRSVGWLVGWLFSRSLRPSVGDFFCWLVAWLIVRSVVASVCWSVGRWVLRLIGWVVGLTVGRLVGLSVSCLLAPARFGLVDWILEIVTDEWLTYLSMKWHSSL